MRHIFWRASGWLLRSLIAVLLATLPTQADTSTADTSMQIATARAATKELGENLKSQLMAAIKSGGVISAIAVCKTIAPAIAADASSKHDVTVRRTALKIRNPRNAADAFETRVLEEFVRKLEAGADPMTVDYSETVTNGGTTVFRYMKAIPTAAEPCLACHGSDVTPEVKAEITKLYPLDQAIGFKAGALRGAFSVSIPIK
jgi:hypothetical protein